MQRRGRLPPATLLAKLTARDFHPELRPTRDRLRLRMPTVFEQLPESFFKQCVDALRDGVAIEENGALSYINARLAEQLGRVSRDAIYGRPLVDVLKKQLSVEGLSQLLAAVKSAHTGPDGATIEVSLSCIGPHQCAYEVSIATSRHSRGTTLVFTFKDVS